MMEFDGMTYKTYDIGLVAGLLSVGYKITSMNTTEPAKVQFFFETGSDEEKNRLGDSINAYWSHDLNVSALKMFENIKLLKARIYSFKQ